jgi:hypothetical protein
MASEKSLQISAKVNDGDLRRLGSSIKRLQDTVVSLRSALKDVSSAFGGFSKELSKDAVSLDRFRTSLAATSKEFRNQIATIRQYSQALQSATGGGGRGGGGGGGGFNAGGLAGVQIMPAPGGGFVFVPPGGGGGGPGGGGQGGGGGRGGGGGNAQVARQMQQLAMSGANVSDMVNNFKTARFVNTAKTEAYRGQIYRGALSGDFSDIFALQLAASKGQSVSNLGGGRGAAVGSAAGRAVGEVGGGFATGGPVGALVGAVKGVGGLFSSSATGEVTAQEAQNMQTIANTIKPMNPELAANWDLFTQMSPSLMQANRRLGGGGLRAAGIGAQAGMMPTEAMAMMTQMAGQFGTGAVFGQDTLGGMAPTGKMVTNPAFKKYMSTRGIVGAANDVSGLGQFFTPNQNIPEMARKVIPGRGLGDIASEAARFGFDPSSVGGLVGGMGMAQTGTGSSAQRIKTADEAFQAMIHEGIAVKIKDVNTLEALSKAVGEAAIAAASVSNVGSLGRFLVGGLNTETASPAMISQRMYGLQSLGAGMQGNPLMSVLSTQAARGILGPGASAFATGLLGHSTLQQLMGPSAIRDVVFGGAKNDPRMKELEAQKQLLTNIVSGGKGPEATELTTLMGGKGLSGLATTGNLSKEELAKRKRGLDLYTALTNQFSGFSEDQFGQNRQAIEALANFSTLPQNKQTFGAFQGMAQHGGLAESAQQAAAGAQTKALHDLLSDGTAVQNMEAAFKNFGTILSIGQKMPTEDHFKDATLFLEALEKFVNKITPSVVAKTRQLDPNKGKAAQ